MPRLKTHGEELVGEVLDCAQVKCTTVTMCVHVSLQVLFTVLLVSWIIVHSGDVSTVKANTPRR